MIEKNKNMYDLGDYSNQMVICDCGKIVTVWLNVNGEGKAVCSCKCEITVERKRRSKRIMIYHDKSKCVSKEHNDIISSEEAI